MKIVRYMMEPRLRTSPGHGGQGFLNGMLLIRSGSSPGCDYSSKVIIVLKSRKGMGNEECPFLCHASVFLFPAPAKDFA
jgi:hypothetical protein